MKWTRTSVAAALLTAVSAQDIGPINGNKFLSPYNGKTVTAVSGLVTAIGPSGFWMRSTFPDTDDTTSESIYVFSSTAKNNRTVGDIISLNGRVSEYRSSSAYLYLTEIVSPTNITTLSTGNTVTPVILGQNGLNPPTQQFTSLDNGDVFAVPNNQSQISKVNPVLQPTKYGLDFWESISGELVTIKGARAVSKPNQYGDTWVVGDWPTSGNNSRGGLTITDKDGNPEAIVIGDPLDGTDNPDGTKMGDTLEDITGIVYQVFGFYTILPLTAIKITSSQSPALPPASSLKSTGACGGITVGQYNIENFYKNSSNINQISDHIVNYLNTPDLMFLQEVQDDNGPTNDAIVDANVTLAALRDAINAQSSRTNYSFVDIDPVDDQDGGQPGGNIRNAYLYNPSVIRLRNVNPGNSTQSTQVLAGPKLSLNPGRIDPSNAAWKSSRKPLAAQWETIDGKSTFFTVNVHFTSKGGSTSLHGDPRTPVNLGVDQRNQQANITASFVKQITAIDSSASVIVAGDWNEFQFVQPLKTFASISGFSSLDDVAGIPAVEQYTYLFTQNSQELDHNYVSPNLAKGGKAQYEHVHLNTWVAYDDQASDHDPSVGKFDVCQGGGYY